MCEICDPDVGSGDKRSGKNGERQSPNLQCLSSKCVVVMVVGTTYRGLQTCAFPQESESRELLYDDRVL